MKLKYKSVVCWICYGGGRTSLQGKESDLGPVSAPLASSPTGKQQDKMTVL